MAIFNESYTELMVLNEKKTREEYAKRAIKKKYNFEPDKPGSSTGTITDKQGKKYRVNMDANQTRAYTQRYDSHIDIGKDLYELKGSHKGERRDAVLQHEIGHQNLHNIDPDNKTTDTKNRSNKFFDTELARIAKNATGENINSNNIYTMRKIAHKLTVKSREDLHKEIDKMDDPDEVRYYIENLYDKWRYFVKTGTDEEQDRRDKDFEKAKKFSKESKSDHATATEFEADRFAANRTSERAVKKSIGESKKNSRKEASKYFKKRTDAYKGYLSDDVKSGRVSKENAKDFRKAIEQDEKEDLKRDEEERKTDFEQRSKALKDKDLRNAKTYK